MDVRSTHPPLHARIYPRALPGSSDVMPSPETQPGWNTTASAHRGAAVRSPHIGTHGTLHRVAKWHLPGDRMTPMTAAYCHASRSDRWTGHRAQPRRSSHRRSSREALASIRSAGIVANAKESPARRFERQLSPTAHPAACSTPAARVQHAFSNLFSTYSAPVLVPIQQLCCMRAACLHHACSIYAEGMQQVFRRRAASVLLPLPHACSRHAEGLQPACCTLIEEMQHAYSSSSATWLQPACSPSADVQHAI